MAFRPDSSHRQYIKGKWHHLDLYITFSAVLQYKKLHVMEMGGFLSRNHTKDAAIIPILYLLHPIKELREVKETARRDLASLSVHWPKPSWVCLLYCRSVCAHPLTIARAPAYKTLNNMSTFREIIGCCCGMQHHCGEAFSQKSKQPPEKARERTIYCSYADLIQCDRHRYFMAFINNTLAVSCELMPVM